MGASRSPIRLSDLKKALRSAPRRRIEIAGFAPAAVLVPIIVRADSVTLGYTLRPQGMPTHAAQISFPGGRREPKDPDLTATALREAHEELGLEAAHIDVIGKIDDVATPRGFVITPVVGWLDDPPPIEADGREVEQYFEVEIDEFADPANFSYRGEREIAGVTYRIPEYRVAGRVIWGATARITQRLLELIEIG